MDEQVDNVLGVPEIFIGKSVFITGGSGFVGKVLIEKILRNCPGVDKIYMLIREKRGKTAQERIDELSAIPVFERLHKERPGDFAKKVIPINGDVAAIGLGLSPEDRQLLIAKVHMVYHVAATVKFDQAITDAIFMNVRGTREMCRLSLEMKHIELMCHISTAYAHAEYNPIEEKMYPAPADWKKIIQAAETINPHELSMMQLHMLGPYPNTYTFTKSLAERVVFDYLDGKLLNFIIRPSIVCSSWKEPVPGWIDNFNGPVGMMLANATGLIRINLVKDHNLDFVPVDMLSRAILNCTWDRVTQNYDDEISKKSTTVHNCSANSFAQLSTLQLAALAQDLCEEVAVSTCVWYPTLRRTENQTIFNIIFLSMHLLPAMFFDLILRMLNYPPVVLGIQRRIFVAVNALKFFILNEWKILNDSLYNLESKLPARDFNEFGYEADKLIHRPYIKNAMWGSMKYLLKEDMTKIKSNCTRLRMLKYLDKIFSMAFCAYLFHLIVFKWNILGLVYNGMGDYFNSLHIPLFINESGETVI